MPVPQKKMLEKFSTYLRNNKGKKKSINYETILDFWVIVRPKI